MPLSKSSDLAPTTPFRLSRQVPLVAVLFLLTLGGIGITLYQSVRKQIAIEATSNLESIAILKVGQIESWLDEARSDANLTINTESFATDLRTWLDSGKRNDKQRKLLLARLEELTSVGRFRYVSLYDAKGALLMTTAASGNPEKRSELVVAATNQGEMKLDEFHIDDASESKEASVGFFSPIRIAATSAPIAVLHVSLIPGQLLYPLLQQWPGMSPSAETLLVRRDAGDVVFLNTLRHRKDAPLSLRLPLSTPNLLAAMALKGKSGGISGVDYRKQPCLAYTMPVPGTSWHILSKIDEDEVFANLNSLTRIAAVLVGLHMLTVALWIIYYYRGIEVRYNAQAERLLLSDRINILVRNANDCIFLLDANDRIIDVNDRCLGTYGYTREEMLAMTGDQLLADDESGQLQTLRRQDRDGRLFYTTRHRRRDGSVFPVEISQVALHIGGVRRTQKIIRDISERENSFARITRLSQMYATLSAVNRAVARSKAIDEVFLATCCACVERGGLVQAWIGLSGPDGESITVSQCSGAGFGDLAAGTRISIRADTPGAGEPAAIAFREQHSHICNDFAGGPAARGGICSMIALPIVQDGVTAGVLTAYSNKANFFDAQIERLLQEIADSLSFAMHNFAENEAKLRAEAKLRQSEELLNEAQQTARIGHWQYDLETKAIYWSPQMYKLFERDPALGPAAFQDGDSGYSPYQEQLALDGTRKAINTCQRVDLELQLDLSDHRIAYHAASIIPLRNEGGSIIMLRGTVQDITERKLAEKGLLDTTNSMLQYAQEVEDLYQNAPCGYHSLDKDGVFQRINETELRWLGFRRDEVIGKMCLKDLLPPEQVSSFHETFPRLIATGEIRDLEIEFIRKDGSRLPVLVNATAVLDDQGRFLMTRSTLYDMTERKKMESERLDHSRRLALLSRRLVTAQEKGRRELSAALHDQTSPNLAALDINLNLIAKLIPENRPPLVADLLEDTKALLKDTNLSIREICSELRPPVLDYAGLVPALEGYARQFSRRTGTAVRINCPDPATRLEPDKESMLFRIVQEAMTNSAKHANASSIEVTLKKVNGSTIMTIADDGSGFDPEQIWENGKNIGQGVLNMREISEFIGGSFTIDSCPGKGTTISIEFQSLLPTGMD